MTDSRAGAGPNRSPPRATVPVRAFFCDTYGTLCDFYGPLTRAFAQMAQMNSVHCDAGALALAWRTAYVRAMARHTREALPFRPLTDIHRENLVTLLAERFPIALDADAIETLVSAWNRLEPWPDVPAGLRALKQLAIIAPLSNGNFVDMVSLARHANLPWDIILGSSIARAYKPHPQVYLQGAAALDLAPQEVCMVAAHQYDLHHAAGHGMQTAFVIRPLEFGGATRPRAPQPDVAYGEAAEIHPEFAWTYVATDLLDLARQYCADAQTYCA